MDTTITLTVNGKERTVVTDPERSLLDVLREELHLTGEAFECGPIQNPANLLSQVQGCIIMGLGAALREEMQFKDGKILNASFVGYLVPRFKDVPKIDVHLINKADIPSAGGGETPIIAIAPAIANAVFAATGVRICSMPLRGGRLKQS